MFLILLLALFLTACGVDVSLSTDSGNVTSSAAKIADFDLPAGYYADFSSDVMGYSVAAYTRGDGPSHIYLIQSENEADGQKFDQVLDQIVIGSGDPQTRMMVIGTRSIIVRGQESTLVISEAVLFFGSMFIFPLTQGLLRLLKYPARVSHQNGLWGLGSQIAFTVPINFLLVGAATLYHQNWFSPAAMIVFGAHYLPFVTLYGMKMFAILAAVLVLAGTTLAFYGSDIFSLGSWFTAAVLILFAFVGRKIVLQEERTK